MYKLLYIRIESNSMIRLFDIVLASVGLTISMPLLLGLWVVAWIDTRAPLFRQERVGRYQIPFTLLKFRSMRVGTPSIATHMVSSSSVTRIGGFLRRTKLDELPQIWNVLVGDMSFVGPRPSLFSQTELLHARQVRGVFEVRPGITGLAQVQGIDMSCPELLAELDARMIRDFSIGLYLILLVHTVLGRGAGDRISVSHDR